MQVAQFYQRYFQNSKGSITIDSRRIQKGDIFIAIKGEHFNGNEFAKESLDKGALIAVVSDPKFIGKAGFHFVPNSLTFLHRLAAWHRKQFRMPVLAITGSNGKTTTKNLIQSCLSKKYREITTLGNYNNHIGVPLTLFRLHEEIELAVIEMGANHRFEIQQLCHIAQPTYGLITNIGKAHLEGFGGEEGVYMGKSELPYYLDATGGCFFINEDEPSTRRLINKIENQLRFSSENIPGDIKVICQSVQPKIIVSLHYNGEVFDIHSSLYGHYNYLNILQAVGIAAYFNVPPDQIRSGIEGYVPDNNRSQRLQYNQADVFLDAYNANPSSMHQALRAYFDMSISPRILCLGEMKEIGDGAIREHQEVLTFLEGLEVKQIFLLGTIWEKLDLPKNAVFFEEFQAMKSMFDLITSKEKCSVLIKGSRSLGLERLIANKQ